MGNPFSRPCARRTVTFDSISAAAPVVGDNISTAPVVGVPVAVSISDANPSDANLSNANLSNANLPSPPLALTVSSEKQAVAYGSADRLLAMLSIKAPPAPADERRAPIDLVAAIDRSGSMCGEKMRLMKQTLELLVKRAGLRDDDRLSLVTFDSSVKLALPLSSMDTAGRQSAEDVVKQLNCGSTTNLSGGALKAIDVLDASATSPLSSMPNVGVKDGVKDGEGRTRSVMLFTDGLANEGITDTPRLVSAVSGALRAASAKLGGPISLYTFGFGAQHNEDCLRTLATGSGASGLYYFIDSADDIPNAFADCLGGLTSVVAQNTALSLEPLDGAFVSRVLGSTYARDADGSLLLGDLFADDQKDVLVELSLPTCPREIDSTTVLRATLRGFNVPRAAPDVVVTQLSVARPSTTPASQPVNQALDAQRNRIEAAEAMEKASAMADRGDVAGGRSVLRNAKLRITASPSAAHALSSNLASEFDALEQLYTSTERYRGMGSKMSKMQAMSHSRQRAVHTNADTYHAGAKRKAAMKAAWFASSAAGSASGSDSD